MGFAARLALLCALAVTMLGAAAPESLPQLLDRMRERGGPVWRAHMISASALTIDNRVANVRSDSEGLPFSTYQCRQQLCTGTYFDGERVFSININGTALPQSDGGDAFLRAERTIATHAFLDPAFVDNGGEITDDGWTTIEGTRYRTLLVANTASMAMEVLVDPATAYIRFIRDVNGDATIEYRDYRRIDPGLALPFLVLRDGAVMERYDSRATASGSFDGPRGLQPTFQGAPVAVAMDASRSIPLFPCTVGGVATTCLLDTGNSGLSISQELSAQLRARAVGQMQVAGLGEYAAQVVRAGPLAVGNATFPIANYTVLRDIHRFGYDVVLGADVLAATRIELDATQHRITFDAAMQRGEVSVPLHFEDFVPTLVVQLGNVGAQLALDTGDESNINLSYDFYSEHRDLFSATEQRAVNGVGGSSVELIGTIPDVRIGTLDAREQPIGTTAMLHSTAYGHLGAAFLGQFNIILDYARRRVDFAPSTGPEEPSSGRAGQPGGR
ncbi:MAG TPA: aspartyl protease family protein [Candidatus Baltobacteraceae bacterium]|jgi:hypothetical protein|nr:aspartyl protease family protein [Candidatus Baltobacteraceae bacterium]